MPALVVTVVSAKGGVGKTNTSFALAAAAVSLGQSVLAIDLDPNCGLTTVLSPGRHERTIANAVADGEVGAQAVNVENATTSAGRLNLIPGSPHLDAAPATAPQIADLVEAVKRDGRWDLVLLDTQPHRPTFAGPMGVADRIVIPTDIDYLSIRSASLTAYSAVQLGCGDAVGGVVINNAKRPMAIVNQNLVRGLRSSTLAYPTVLWYSSGWVSLRSGHPRLPERPLLEIAVQLHSDVTGGLACDPIALEAFAGIARASGMVA